MNFATLLQSVSAGKRAYIITYLSARSLFLPPHSKNRRRFAARLRRRKQITCPCCSSSLSVVSIVRFGFCRSCMEFFSDGVLELAADIPPANK